MRWRERLCSAVLLSGAWLCAAPGALAPAAEPIDFDKQIAPIFASRCLDCHNGSEPKGKLNLASAAAFTAGGENGPAVVAGKPDESYLWERIEAGEMPPKKPLPENERALIKAWIAAGAHWGTDPIDAYRFTTAVRAGADWWSLQPLVRPQPPAAVDPASVSNPIDAFLQAKLVEKKLGLSPAADRRTLIRRLYFDLIGLPPTPEEVRQFAADESADAYKNLVQKLLASPHYGERWARHWLDVAHFGESDGFEYDRMRPSAWRYRDWVINSLNQDLPYDEFARQQIAGDVLEPRDAAGLIATGFLVAGPYDNLTPASEVMSQIMRQDELEDVVGIVGQTFLGLTVHCARCHDHKFDPIRQRDYYRLAAALAGVRRGERDIPPPPLPAELANRLAALKKQIAEIEDPSRRQIIAERETAAKSRPAPPTPLASWDFSADLRDQKGQLHGAAQGQARIGGDGLFLNGEPNYVSTLPLEKDLTEKTLEAWVQLANLEQRGGAAISVQTLNGDRFDAIVFGEQEPGKWMAGSDGFGRTRSFEGPAEAEAREKIVHFAIVYSADGKITGYRNGVPYGNAYQSKGLATFKRREAQVVFGLRHSPVGGGKHLTGLISRAKLYDRALAPDEVAASAGVLSRFVRPEELLAKLAPDARQRLQTLQREREELDVQSTRLQTGKTFAITPKQPDATHLLVRGSPVQLGEKLAPGGLPIASGRGPAASGDFGLEADSPEGLRRIRLAEWVTRGENPLFARAMVNRVWQYHFGRGLVDTPNDLGFSGGEPPHRELLDWLAAEFIEKRWSLKELHRVIVLSAAYQQSSATRPDGLSRDADNRLLWRYSPHRLDAETLRDAILSVAGQLNPAVGGPSFQDFRPYFHKGSQFYEPQDPVGAEFNRRSVYRMWARGGKNPLLDTFDCPDPSTTAPKRGSTTTPLQALSLMNNSFLLRMAEHFAQRVEKEAGPERGRQLDLAFQLAIGRAAQPAELEASRELAAKHGLVPLCRVLLNSNGFLYVH